MVKIGKQGEIELEAKDSYISFKVKSFENNKDEGKEAFNGEIKIQPHRVFDFLEVIYGEQDFTVLKSGISQLRIKNKMEKGGIRIHVIKTDGSRNIVASSSFLILNSKLNALKNELLKEIKNLKAVSIAKDDFHLLKTGEIIVMRNENKELFLDDTGKEQLKNIIFNNFIISNPRPIQTKLYKIDEERNLVFRGLLIPKEVIRKIYILF